MKLLKNISFNIKNYCKSIDLVLLIFLSLVLNVSLPLKLLGVIFIYCVQFNIKSIRADFKSGALPKFYILIGVCCIIGFLINYKYWSINYIVLTGFAFLFWVLSVLILNQLKIFVERSSLAKIHQTLVLFFCINGIISVLNLVHIILITKNLNPYTSLDPEYSASTGDFITGVFFDFSTTNSIINIFGLIYFLFKSNIKMSLLCLFVVLLTTSNTNIVFLILALIAIMLVHKNKYYKSISMVYIAVIIVFFAKISPTNVNYVSVRLMKKSPTELASNKGKEILSTSEDKKRKIELFQNQHNYQSSQSPLKDPSGKIEMIAKNVEKTAFEKQKSKSIFEVNYNYLEEKKHSAVTSRIEYFYHDSTVHLNEFKGKNYPGKLMSCIQTLKFSISSVKNFFIGAGAGMFSSKVAFKATGIGTFGKYPKKYEYVSKDFLVNHLKVYFYFFSKDSGQHSVTNTPFSVYNQLLGEYGGIGLFIFVIYYIWFFIKRFGKLTYGKYLLPLFLLFLILDYWFEHLSIVIIFELLMLMDIKKQEDIIYQSQKLSNI